MLHNIVNIYMTLFEQVLEKDHLKKNRNKNF